MITCPRCQATSHHPEDERQGYCARCCWWTSDPQLGQLEPPVEPLTHPGGPSAIFLWIIGLLVLYGLIVVLAWVFGAF